MVFDARSNSPKGHRPKPVEDEAFFWFNIFKEDMDSIVIELELKSVAWEALKNTCPEDDSGAAVAELISLKNAESLLHAWSCTPQSSRLKQVHPDSL